MSRALQQEPEDERHVRRMQGQIQARRERSVVACKESLKSQATASVSTGKDPVSVEVGKQDNLTRQLSS